MDMQIKGVRAEYPGKYIASPIDYILLIKRCHQSLVTSHCSPSHYLQGIIYFDACRTFPLLRVNGTSPKMIEHWGKEKWKNTLENLETQGTFIIIELVVSSGLCTNDSIPLSYSSSRSHPRRVPAVGPFSGSGPYSHVDALSMPKLGIGKGIKDLSSLSG